MDLWKRNRVRARLEVAAGNEVRAVFQELEQRRLLSFDGGGLAPDGEDDGAGVEEAVTLEAGDDIRILSEPTDESAAGEMPEEWMYLTMMPAEGDVDGGGEDDRSLPVDEEPVYKGDDGEVPPDGVIYTMSPRDGTDEEGGEATDDGGVVKTDDGEVVANDDEIRTLGGAGGGPSVARLKANGDLIVRGTGRADAIDVTPSADGTKVVVTVNGVTQEFAGGAVHLLRVFGGGGGDSISVGRALAARVHGGFGNDTISTGGGDDQIFGGKGADDLFGGGGADRLIGGRGDDVLRGGVGSDDLAGGRGNDRLFGEAGDDRIRGGRGRDHVRGGNGNDVMSGGAGADRMMGGAGTDAEQDVLDGLSDPDAGDDLFSSVRMAMPVWWTDGSDGSELDFDPNADAPIDATMPVPDDTPSEDMTIAVGEGDDIGDTSGAGDDDLAAI